MKRFISVLLALCLLCSFVPVIGASAEEGEESGITVVYDYASLMPTKDQTYINDFDTSSLSFENSHNLWAYANRSNYDIRFRNGKIIHLGSNGVWITMEIYVPQSGLYTLEQVYTTNSGSGKLDVYMIPKGENKAYSASLINGVTPIISQSCAGDDEKYLPLATPRKVEDVQLNAGYYYVVYKANGGKAMFGNLTLNGGEGKVATAIEFSNAPEELIAGQAGTLSANVYYSDTTYVENVTDGVTYESDKEYFTFSEGGAYTTSPDAEGADTITPCLEGVPSIGSTVNFIKNGQIKIKYDLGAGLAACLNKYADSYSSTTATYIKGEHLNTLTFDETNNLYAFEYANTSDQDKAVYYNQGVYFIYPSGAVQAWEINVPEAGVYTFSQILKADSKNGTISIYIIPKEDNAAFTESLLVSDYKYVDSYKITTEETKTVENIPLKKGKYYLAYKKTEGADYPVRLSTASLTAGDNTAVVDISGVDDMTLDVTTSNTAALAPTVHFSDTEKDAAYTGITYESSNRNVAAVSGSTITAVDEGTATVSVKAGDYTETVEVSVTDTQNPNKVVAKDATVTVSVFAEDDDNNNLISVPGLEVGAVDGTVLRGTELTAAATDDDETYQFLYWMDGNTKKFLSADAEYTFTATTNGSVCAVFSKRDELYVDYFTSSGRKLSGGVGISVPEFEKDAGYTGGKWAENETLISGISNYKLYMPEYGAADVQASKVTVDGEDHTTGKYNDPVTVTEGASNFTGWKKNGAMVSYASSYTFHLWNAAETLQKIFDGEKETAPAVVLFRDGEQYMLELVNFDGIEIIEKGVLIDSDEEMSIDSFGGKLRSQVTEAKQFTISTDASYVRAYAVYKDGGANGNVRVAYSDVISDEE